MSTCGLAVCILLLTAACAPLRAQSYNGKTAIEWTRDLDAADDETRETAIWSLVAMEQRAVRPLIRALADERAAVRSGAVLALGRLGPLAAEGRETLEKLRADPHPSVAAAARVAWIRVQVDAARVPALIEALAEADWDTRLAAADVLEALGKQAAPAAPALAALLQQPGLDRTVEQPRAHPRTWNVRRSAALALGAIGVVEGVDSTAILAEVLAGKEWASREGAAMALGRLGPAAGAALPTLLLRLRTEDRWEVRRAIAAALPQIVGAGATTEQYDQAIAAALAAATEDVEPGVRRLALEFLGHCGARAAAVAPRLVERMPKLAWEQECVARAIGAMGPAAKAVAPALVEWWAGLEQVDHMDARSACQAIVDCLHEIDPKLHSSLPALDALLRELERPRPAADVRRHEAITDALAGLRGDTEQARLEALRQLAMLRATVATASVKEFLGEGHSVPERVEAVKALTALDAVDTAPSLRPMLAAKDGELRYAAAMALAQFADAESLPRVTRYFSLVASSASKDELLMLGFTGVQGLAPVLQRIAADAREGARRRWGAVTGLGLLAVHATAPAIADFVDGVAGEEGLKDSERNELLSAGLGALAQLDPGPYRERFTRFARSDDQDVHTSALWGLAMLGDAEAKATIQRDRHRAWSAAYDLPPLLRQKLEGVHVRLSQVRGCTLREVAATLQKALGMPVEIDAPPGHAIFTGRFGNYIDFIGFHPSALAVLYSGNMAMFSAGEVVPEVTVDKIVLRPPAAAGK